MDQPLISIITATYKGSHFLVHSIPSVIRQDYQNWELIVVGDGCTDETEEVVASFGDPRIHFFNLEQNSGQQATPNNFGLQKAKGEFVCFLNQDDLFLSDHLGKCLQEIQDAKADFLVVPGLKVNGETILKSANQELEVELCSVLPNGKFSPKIFCVASSWFFKHSLIDQNGPWRMEKDLYVTPSQEWIFRAFLKKAKFHNANRIGVIVLLSGERRNSYLKKDSPEHRLISTNLQQDSFLKDLYEKGAIRTKNELQNHLYFSWNLFLRWILYLPIDWILIKLEIHPNAFRFRRAWKKRGELVRKVRKTTGLDPVG